MLINLAEHDPNFDPALGLLARKSKTSGYHTRLPEGTYVHETRTSMHYALACLAACQAGHADGQTWRLARARTVIDAVLKLQDIDPMSPTFGNWSYFYEEPLEKMAPPDWNWADFIGAAIAQMLAEHGEHLDDALRHRMRFALDCAAMCIFRRKTSPGYTNIAIMGAGVCAAAGELLDRPVLLDYGRRRLQAVLDLANELGAVSEYNSPTYTMVAVEECERILAIVKSTAVRRSATELLEAVWKMVEEHWHPPTNQWAGPHSRAYSDRLFPSIAERLEHRFEIPAPLPRTVTMNLGVTPNGVRKVGTTWLAPTCCLGAISIEHTWTQRRPLIAYWNAAENVAFFRVQWLMDGRDMPGLRLLMAHEQNRVLLGCYPLHTCGPWHPQFDIPEGGIFTPQDLRLRFLVDAPGAEIMQLSGTRYELAASFHRVRIDLPEALTFDGRAVRVEVAQHADHVTLDLVCAQDGQRVDYPNLQLRLAAAIQLLCPGTEAREATVTINDRPAGADRIIVAAEGLTGQTLDVPARAEAFDF